MLLAKLPAGCSMLFILLCLWYLQVHKGDAKQQSATATAGHVSRVDTRHCFHVLHATMHSPSTHVLTVH
jgi:hypothetical protein